MNAVENHSNPPPVTLESVQQAAADLGFAIAGVCDARPIDRADFFRQWLNRPAHGEMRYLADHFDKRIDPAALLPGARSIICVADHHHSDSKPDADDFAEKKKTPRGRIARYAWGDDYHKVIKKRLFMLADTLRERHPGESFKAAVDTAPVMERDHAARAGLGWIGKHTLLLHPRLGSYLLLGEIITTLAIETSEQRGFPRQTVPPTDHCGTCTRCIDACPTDCITPYQLQADRCISYLTIEHRSLIDTELHDAMGDWIAGCDICQEVCPHNREGRPAADKEANTPPPHPRYTPRPPAPSIDLLEILNWTADDRTKALRGTAIKRIKLDMFKRNALIAAANALKTTGNPALRDRIEAIARDPQEPPLVRDTARQVLARFNPSP